MFWCFAAYGRFPVSDRNDCPQECSEGMEIEGEGLPFEVFRIDRLKADSEETGCFFCFFVDAGGENRHELDESDDGYASLRFHHPDAFQVTEALDSVLWQDIG